MEGKFCETVTGETMPEFMSCSKKTDPIKKQFNKCEKVNFVDEKKMRLKNVVFPKKQMKIKKKRENTKCMRMEGIFFSL